MSQHKKSLTKADFASLTRDPADLQNSPGRVETGRRIMVILPEKEVSIVKKAIGDVRSDCILFYTLEATKAGILPYVSYVFSAFALSNPQLNRLAGSLWQHKEIGFWHFASGSQIAIAIRRLCKRPVDEKAINQMFQQAESHNGNSPSDLELNVGSQQTLLNIAGYVVEQAQLQGKDCFEALQMARNYAKSHNVPFKDKELRQALFICAGLTRQKLPKTEDIFVLAEFKAETNDLLRELIRVLLEARALHFDGFGLRSLFAVLLNDCIEVQNHELAQKLEIARQVLLAKFPSWPPPEGEPKLGQIDQFMDLHFGKPEAEQKPVAVLAKTTGLVLSETVNLSGEIEAVVTPTVAEPAEAATIAVMGAETALTSEVNQPISTGGAIIRAMIELQWTDFARGYTERLRAACAELGVANAKIDTWYTAASDYKKKHLPRITGAESESAKPSSAPAKGSLVDQIITFMKEHKWNDFAYGYLKRLKDACKAAGIEAKAQITWYHATSGYKEWYLANKQAGAEIEPEILVPAEEILSETEPDSDAAEVVYEPAIPAKEFEQPPASFAELSEEVFDCKQVVNSPVEAESDKLAKLVRLEGLQSEAEVLPNLHTVEIPTGLSTEELEKIDQLLGSKVRARPDGTRKYKAKILANDPEPFIKILRQGLSSRQFQQVRVAQKPEVIDLKDLLSSTFPVVIVCSGVENFESISTDMGTAFFLPTDEHLLEATASLFSGRFLKVKKNGHEEEHARKLATARTRSSFVQEEEAASAAEQAEKLLTEERSMVGCIIQAINRVDEQSNVCILMHEQVCPTSTIQAEYQQIVGSEAPVYMVIAVWHYAKYTANQYENIVPVVAALTELYHQKQWPLPALPISLRNCQTATRALNGSGITDEEVVIGLQIMRVLAQTKGLTMPLRPSKTFAEAETTAQPFAYQANGQKIDLEQFSNDQLIAELAQRFAKKGSPLGKILQLIYSLEKPEVQNFMDLASQAGEFLPGLLEAAILAQKSINILTPLLVGTNSDK